MLKETLPRLLAGDTLTRREARGHLDHLLHEDPPPAAVAAFLTLLQSRGPTPEEVAGFADSLLAAAVPFPDPPGDAIDTCGTGGDGSNTFNISTVAALVAAAAGAKVYKHGNRAATSRSGSADLLQELGVPIDLEPAAAAESARRHGFTFLHARRFHPVVAKVAPIRGTIGFPTVFNLLGPLANPARVERQVIGVYSPTVLPLMARALALRGARHALVLHGAGGLDEATPLGPFQAHRVIEGEVHEESRDPADLGIPPCALEDLAVDGPAASRAVATAVLDGRAGAPRDAVLLNAALALEVAGVASDWREGFERARDALDQGAPRRLLQQLRQESDG